MPKSRGNMRIKGTLDEWTFYRGEDGGLVRFKGGVSGERIASDPTFARTRANGMEFGHAAKMGKLFRLSIIPMLQSSADGRVTSRLTKVMTDVKNFDASNEHGFRRVAQGIDTPEGKALFRGLDLNIKSALSTVVFKPVVLNPATGVITITDLRPDQDVSAPQGAMEVIFKGAWVKVDFENEVFTASYTNVQALPLNSTVTTVTLTPTSVPTGTGTNFFFLEVSFAMVVNGVEYRLQNKAFNALKILDVS